MASGILGLFQQFRAYGTLGPLQPWVLAVSQKEKEALVGGAHAPLGPESGVRHLAAQAPLGPSLLTVPSSAGQAGSLQKLCITMAWLPVVRVDYLWLSCDHLLCAVA